MPQVAYGLHRIRIFIGDLFFLGREKVDPFKVAVLHIRVVELAADKARIVEIRVAEGAFPRCNAVKVYMDQLRALKTHIEEIRRAEGAELGLQMREIAGFNMRAVEKTEGEVTAGKEDAPQPCVHKGAAPELLSAQIDILENSSGKGQVPELAFGGEEGEALFTFGLPGVLIAVVAAGKGRFFTAGFGASQIVVHRNKEYTMKPCRTRLLPGGSPEQTARNTLPRAARGLKIVRYVLILRLPYSPRPQAGF